VVFSVMLTTSVQIFSCFQDSLKQSDVIYQGDRVHSYKFEFADNYLKISLSDGSAKPRNPNVFNVKTREQEPNPRQLDQAEPKEFFALLDFSNSYLWLSNTQKKTMITDYPKMSTRKYIADNQ